MISPLPGSVRAVSVPLAGMLFTQTSAVMSLFVYAAICVGPLAFTASVSLAGSYPPAYWLGAAVSLVATFNLLRIPTASGR